MPKEYTRLVWPLADRFWSKVDKWGPTLRTELGPCWVWLAATQPHGYGALQLREEEHPRGVKGPKGAHVIAMFLAYGRWPTLDVLHRCDNPPCVKAVADEYGPAHLDEGTALQNARDMVARGRHRPSGLKHEAHPMARLTQAKVLEIRSRWALGESQARIAEAFGVDRSTVYHVVHRKHWR